MNTNLSLSFCRERLEVTQCGEGKGREGRVVVVVRTGQKLTWASTTPAAATEKTREEGGWIDGLNRWGNEIRRKPKHLFLMAEFCEVNCIDDIDVER